MKECPNGCKNRAGVAIEMELIDEDYDSGLRMYICTVCGREVCEY